MNYRHQLLLFQTVTPLHVGCGQDVGVVDLPVIRERTTGWPFVPGSGVRGALRSRYASEDRDGVRKYFGPDVDEAGEEEVRYAGCVAVHDAKILLFPVRADREVYLWLTCPAALRRFAREVAFFKTSAAGALARVPDFRPGEGCYLGPDGLAGGVLHLEEYVYEPAAGDGLPAARAALAAWTGAVGAVLGLPELASRTVLVGDADFGHFVRLATLVQQHNRLTSAKTVDEGALFSVEAVPPEAVFYGFFGATASRWQKEGEDATPEKEILATVRTVLAPPGDAGPTTVLHLGGDESTGLGVTRIHWCQGG